MAGINAIKSNYSGGKLTIPLILSQVEGGFLSLPKNALNRKLLIFPIGKLRINSQLNTSGLDFITPKYLNSYDQELKDWFQGR